MISKVVASFIFSFHNISFIPNYVSFFSCPFFLLMFDFSSLTFVMFLFYDSLSLFFTFLQNNCHVLGGKVCWCSGKFKCWQRRQSCDLYADGASGTCAIIFIAYF